MARVNISIPDDLRESMVGLNCNWSALAQEAFAHAVELEQLKGQGLELEAGLTRLRADKHRHSEREHATGFLHGSTWALQVARYDELAEVAASQELRSQPALAVQWVNQNVDSNAFDLPGMPKSDVSTSYAVGYLAGASDVFSKV